MTNQEIIVNCCKVNKTYMRLPAGQVSGLETMTSLYTRIAEQSLECALAWQRGSPSYPHEPAVDAFWWAVVAWADGFGLSIGVDMKEWSRNVVYSHEQFANYLKPGNLQEPLHSVDGSPANIILELDAKWMELVIILTAKWGLFHHLKDMPAKSEAEKLGAELRKPDSPAYKAYLESDVVFLRAFFACFPFSQQTKTYLNLWLKRVKEEI